MKNYIFGIMLALGLIMFLNFDHVEASKLPDPKFEEKLLEKSKKQGEIIKNIVEIYSSHGIDSEKLKENGEGYFYFGEDGYAVVVQLSQGEKNKELKKKVKKAVDEIIKKHGYKVKINEVKYTYNDLVTIQEQLLNEYRKITDNFVISIREDKQIVEVQVKSLSDLENVNFRLANHQSSEIVNIIENPELDVTPYKKRWDDWNQLGAGLAIKFYDANAPRPPFCSTAGVARSGTKYFLITAGHCLEGHSNTNVYQYKRNVGGFTNDHNFINRGYDIGLVTVTNANNLDGGRYASNGFYQNPVNVTGYDKAITGTTSHIPIKLTVCKTGTTTGFTCGEVVRTRDVYPDGLVRIRAEKTVSQGIFAAKGDSGGAVITNDYKLAGVVQGGTTTTKVTIPAGLGGGTTDGGYDLYFTPWSEFESRYGITLYTSSSPYKIVN